MNCPADYFVVKAMIMVVRLTVMEPDEGKFNHLMETTDDCRHRELAIAWNQADKPLGKEGEVLQVKWTGTCKKVWGIVELPEPVGPKGYDAWMCDADEIELW